MAEVNLQEIHDTLLSIAFEAGRMILGANPNDVSTGTKLNSVDIVTETDQAVERMISTRLKTTYPTFAFVGEETYVAGETRVTDAPTFIVDPIDGTTNFIHGFPNACVSLGFAVGRVPSVGVVYNPFQDLLFTGIRGHGSFVQRNASLAEGAAGRGPKQRLPLAGRGSGAAAPPLTGLGAALVAVEWGSSRDGPNFEVKARTFERLAASREAGGSMVHSLRSLGSAALNLCACAAGQVDAYWEGGCYAWDVCAGWCILAEAGGFVASGNPGEWEPAIDSRVYLAVRGAPSGQRELVEEFWAVIGDGRMDYQH
ncbi:inositol monophosphatase 2 [Phialemonium atrogriseum]|uniref:Inositol-1-monophosphatase n=1 Tax=Phialemonium atrogriseum TaxID=1093897 RepID=A0AAJ0C7M4_9PEZI|nr:inositol monophosphatase 2 [Phialemonium atrogriseum]KAK1771653.1 inositol monophosphatase 2 [Phialemonium atrogriseum]